MRLCVNSKAMQVKVQRENESCNGTMKENRNNRKHEGNREGNISKDIRHDWSCMHQQTSG